MLRHVLSIALFFAMFSFSSASPLEVGAPAPVVTALAETGDSVDLGAVYKENKYTLVYFYPKAFTGGCTAQGCSLRDAYDTLHAKGVAIYGVSTDDVETQRKFKEEYKYPFILLADTDKTVMKAFGQSGIAFASRQAYLIKDSKIVYADHKGSTKKQADDILAFLATQGD